MKITAIKVFQECVEASEKLAKSLSVRLGILIPLVDEAELEKLSGTKKI